MLLAPRGVNLMLSPGDDDLLKARMMAPDAALNFR